MGIDKTNRASVHKLFSDFAQLKKMLDNIRERFDETSKKCAFESIWRSEMLQSYPVLIINFYNMHLVTIICIVS